MSRLVDERVVEMSFDNKKFEENVGETLDTIDKLKQALDFKDVENGFSDVEKAANGVDLSNISNAFSSIGDQISAWEAIAIGALTAVGAKAVEVGAEIVSSLTIDQVTEGYSKYESKTSSVQTLLNSTGKSLDEINYYLDKLMWYSDETSYSFTEMVSALSQAALVGTDLDTATDMIIGIANATAYAGKTGFAFQSTIRNLMQSYGRGSLQAIDWKSLVLQGTATSSLVEELIRAGEELGRIEEGYVTVGSFMDSLQSDKSIKGWADQAVMELAFSRFAEAAEETYALVEDGIYDTASEAIDGLLELGWAEEDLGYKSFLAAQKAITFAEAIEATKDAVSSGWMRAFEAFFGDYFEAMELFTDVVNLLWDLFAGPMEKPLEALEIWHDGIENFDDFADSVYEGFSGRGMLFEGIYQIFRTLGDLIDTVKEAWREIFPEKTAEEIAERMLMASYNFMIFTKRVDTFVKSNDRLEKVGRIVQGIASIFSMLAKTASTVATVISSVVSEVFGWAHVGEGAAGLFDIILTILADVGDWLVYISDAYSELIDSFISGGLRGFLDWLIPKLDEVKGMISNWISKIWPVLKNALKWIGGNVLRAIGSAIDWLIPKLEVVGGLVSDWISDALPGLQSAFEWIKTNIINLIGAGLEWITPKLEAVRDAIADWVSRYWPVLKNALSWIGSTILATIVSGITDIYLGLSTLWSWMKKVGTYIYEWMVPAFEAFKNTIWLIWKYIKKYVLETLAWAKDELSPYFEELEKKWESIKEKAEEIWGSVSESITNFYTSSKEKIEDFSKKIMPALGDSFGSFGERVASIFGYFKELGSSIWKELVILWEKIKDAITEHWDLSGLESLGEAFRNFWNKIKPDAPGDQTKSILVAFFEWLLEFLQNIVPALIGLLGDLFTALTKWLGETTFTDIFRTINEVLGVFTMANLTLFTKWLADFAGDLADFPDILKGSTFLGGITKAILEIVAAIIILSFIDSKALYLSLFALDLMIKMLQAFAEGMAILNPAKLLAVSQAVKPLGTAILELSLSLWLLSKLPAEKVLLSAVAIGILLAELAGFMKLLQMIEASKGGLGSVVAGGVFDTLTKIAAAVLILSISLSMVGKLPIEKMYAAAGAIGILLASLGLFMIELGKFGQLNENDISALKLGAFIIMLAAAVQMLAASLLVLGFLPVENLVKGGIAISYILIALGVFMIAMSELKDTAKMAAVGASILLVSYAVINIAAALAALSLVDMAGAWDGVAALAATILLISVLVGGLAQLPNPENMILVAVAFVILSSSFLALSLGLVALAAAINKFGSKTIWTAVGVLAAFSAIIAVILGVLGALGPAIALAGVGALALGLGVLLLVDALVLLIPLLGTILLMPALFVDGFRIIGEALAALVGGLLSSLTTILEEILPAFLGSLLSVFGKTLSELGEGIDDIVVGLMDLLLSVLRAFNAYMAENLVEVSTELGQTAAYLIEALVLAIWEALKKIFTDIHLGPLFEAIGGWISSAFGYLKESFDYYWGYISDWDLSWFDDMVEALDLFAEDVMATAEDLWKGIKAIGEWIWGGFVAIGEFFGKWGEAIAQLFTGLWEGLQQIWAWIVGLFSSNKENLEGTMNGIELSASGFGGNILGIITGIGTSISEFFLNFVNGIIEGVKAFAATFIGVCKGEIDVVDLVSGLFQDAVEAIGEGVQRLLFWVDRIVSWVMEELGLADWYQMAKDWLQGMINGVINFAQGVYDTISNFIDNIIGIVTGKTETASPSKLFARIGGWWDQGLAEGIEDNADLPYDAMSEMTDDMIDTMASALDAVAELADEDVEYTPTIRPVYDMTDVMSGADTINSLLNSDPMALNFKMGETEAMNDVASEIAESNYTVANAIDKAYSKLTDFMNNVKDEFGDNTVTLNVYGTEGQDVNELAEIVSYRINAALQRERAVYS